MFEFIKKEHKLMIMFFLTTISYVESLGLSSLKYVSIAYSIFIIVNSLIKKGFKKKDFKVSLILFLPLSISAIFQNLTITQLIFADFFYLSLILWSLFGYKVIKEQEDILGSAVGILMGLIFGLIISFDIVISQMNSIYNSRNRMWGGFSHPNQLASIALSACIGIILYLYLNGSLNINKKILLYFSIVISIIILYLTKARTSWIAVIVFFVVLNINKIQRWNNRSKILFHMVFIFGSLFIGYYYYTEYALSTDSYLVRLRIFDTMRVSWKTFFVGNGMTNASSLDRSNSGDGAMEIGWIMLFYKNGIIGIIAYLCIFWNWWKGILKSNDYKIKYAFSAVFFSFLITSFGEAFIAAITNVLPMFFLIIMSSLSKNSQKSKLS